MMDNAKWEVVSYGKKKAQGQKLSKSQKKKMAEAMPTLDKNDYQANVKTGFALNGNDSSSDESDGFSAIEMKTKKQQNSPSLKQKKPAQKPKPVKPPTLKEILNNMEVDDLRTTYIAVSKNFPDKPAIWLTDMAAFIDRKIPPGTPGVDKDWYLPSNDDQKGFPHTELHSNSFKYLSSIIENLSPAVLGSFVLSSCQHLQLMVSRGTGCIGTRIILQFIFKRSPRFLLHKSSELSKLISETHGNPHQFLALYWCFTQAGRLNFEVGIRVLLDLLFPHISVKAFGNAIVSFAEELISSADTTRANADTIGYRDFFPLLDVMHASVYDENSIPTNIAPNLMKRLQALYQRTKALSFLCRSDDELKLFFPSLLYRLRQKGGGKLNEELLLCLVHCLINSPQCFGIWKQMHLKHTVQSSILLCHLVKQWSWLQKRLKRSAARDLFSYLVKQHSRDPQKSDGFFIAANAQLLIGSSGPTCMERFVKISFTFCILMALLLTLDIYTRGAYKYSRTRSLLNQYGVAEPMEKSWDSLLVTITPWATFLGSKLCCVRHTLEPYVLKTWDHMKWASFAVYEFVKPYCLLLWTKMEPYVMEMEKQWPHLVEFVSFYLQLIGEYLIKAFWIVVAYLQVVWEYIQRYDWSPVVAFGNKCYSTASYYIQRAYSLAWS